jgi:hypothetical protein
MLSFVMMSFHVKCRGKGPLAPTGESQINVDFKSFEFNKKFYNEEIYERSL